MGQFRHPLALTPIEDRILNRVSFMPGAPRVAGFYDFDDQNAALELEKRGLVRCRLGEGRDRGLLLVERVPGPVTRIYVGGGDEVA